MSFPKGFVATDFFYPTVKQKQNYYITGQDVEYIFSSSEYGEFCYIDAEWKEILETEPPEVYHVFENDNVWLTNWKTSTTDDFLDYRVAISKDSKIYDKLVDLAKKHKVVIP